MSEPEILDKVLVALRRVIRAVDLHSRSLIQRFGLSGPQLIILRELSRLGEVSSGELANAVSLSLATVTGILTRLENRGLVSRRRCDADKRRVMVRATAEAGRILKSAPPPLQESFARQFERLQDWEQALILSSLQRLVAMMEARELEASPILTADSFEALEEACDASPLEEADAPLAEL